MMFHESSIIGRRSLFLTVLVVLGLSGALGVAAPAASGDVAIVDTLGAATPSTQFSVFASGGLSIFPALRVGPEFTLTQPTLITEIGGFLNNCRSIEMNVPQCPTVQPFLVEVLPAVNGVPDPSRVLATFALPTDTDPLVVSYESVAPNLLLGAGTYFALFASQDDDAGFVLGSAEIPFSYQAGMTPAGFVNPFTGSSRTSPSEIMAVRILGRTTAGLLEDLLTAATGVGPGRSLADKVKRAQTHLARNDVAGTCSTLNAFIHEVRAQSGKKIRTAQADALIASARQIETMLGC